MRWTFTSEPFAPVAARVSRRVAAAARSSAVLPPCGTRIANTGSSAKRTGTPGAIAFGVGSGGSAEAMGSGSSALGAAVGATGAASALSAGAALGSGSAPASSSGTAAEALGAARETLEALGAAVAFGADADGAALVAERGERRTLASDGGPASCAFALGRTVAVPTPRKTNSAKRAVGLNVTLL